ncbi:MAG: hypothetical protein GX637_04940 [Clostridiales bacterium]|nr:hypothetical protein [Clostridiales bacterium]
MKRRLMILSLVLILVCPAACVPALAEGAPTHLTIYEGPKTMQSSETALVSVNGYELFVYDVMVNHQHIFGENTLPTTTPMTYFDFEGAARIRIEMPGLPQAVESAVVQPLARGIVPEIQDGAVAFTITEPGPYTVVFNGNVNKALHIFANPLEKDVPDPDDPNVVYIGPGEWVMDAITLTDGQTLYLSGGAVLHSVISVNNASNVRICGRGMIDGSDYPAWNQPGSYARVPIDLYNARGVTVEGISLVNSNCWNLNSFSSRNVTIDNVKIISGRQNGDGFTFQSCTDHIVTNCFARTWDDSLVIKNYAGSTKGITFKNIQVWTDLAQSMEIGYETDKGMTLDPEIKDVLFEDITVLYNFHKPVISIHNSDDAFVHDIVYRNIVVENAFMQGDNGNNKELIEMTLQNSRWSTVRDEFGSIDHVLIDGLTVLNTLDGKVPRSRLSGQSEDNMITNVTLKNVSILGEPISTLKDMKLTVEDYCDGIVIEQDGTIGQTSAASPADGGPSWGEETAAAVVSAPEQTKAERPPCFPDPTANYIPLPETENLALNRPAAQSGVHADVYVIRNVNDGKTDTYWESKGLPAEVVISLEDIHRVSTAAVCLNPSPIWEPRVQEIAVEVSLDGESFTPAAPAARYEFSADTGNRIRIDFAPVEAAYVKVVFTFTSASRSEGAQAAEICIFE